MNFTCYIISDITERNKPLASDFNKIKDSIMYCENLLYNLQDYVSTKRYHAVTVTQVTRLIAIIHGQIDRVLPNGLHDLYICSDVDLEFIYNMLYFAPKSLDYKLVPEVDPTGYDLNTTEGFSAHSQALKDRDWEINRCKFASSYFHHKTAWIFDQVRAEVHRRQQARITPEMRALTAAKNLMNMVRSLEILLISEKKTKDQAAVGLEYDGSRLDWKEQHKFRQTGTNKELTERAKQIAEYQQFIDDVEADKVSIPTPPKPPKAWKQATVGRTDKRSGAKWLKWVAASIPQEELPDTYDRQFAERSYACTLELRAIQRPKSLVDSVTNMYLHGYFAHEARKQDQQEAKTSDLEWRLNELGLTLGLRSLYVPSWEYISPSAESYMPKYATLFHTPKN